MAAMPVSPAVVLAFLLAGAAVLLALRRWRAITVARELARLESSWGRAG